MTASIAYKDLIEEAFIEPIRSVMVIDDEYPTLTNLISILQNGKSQSYSPANLERLQKIIEMCHQEKEWVVDVFDGKNPHLEAVNHIPERLRHSDLVILDYHLDGDKSQDGSKARSILKKLDNNKHFNLVIVHTNGLDGDIQNVFNEILYEFMAVPEINVFETSSEIEEKIEQWLDVNNTDGHLRILSNPLDVKDLLKLVDHNNKKNVLKYLASEHLFKPFSADIDEIKDGIQVNVKEIVKWLIKEKILEISKKFHGNHNCRTLKWEWDSKENINYICTGSVFITVIKKEDHSPVEEIYKKLIDTLVKLDPSPMHLLIAKIRHHMDEIGLEQANLITQNKLAQAGWLYSLLLNSKNNELEHDKAIDIHWEQLGRASKTDL
ncbi:response regulator receiver domain, partial [Acinetobacter baumannii]